MDQNNNEDVTLNDSNEGENLLNSSELDETVKKTLQTTLAQKKHWREKYEKDSTFRKELEEKLKARDEELAKFKSQKQENPEISSRVEQLEKKLEKSHFSRVHQLDDDETELIYNYALGKKITPEQAKEDKHIKLVIDSIRSQKKAEQATPSSSKTIKFENGKTYDKMNSEERKQNFGKFVEAKLKK